LICIRSFSSSSNNARSQLG
jgi:hypothetical protein